MITDNGLEFGQQCSNMIIIGYQVQMSTDVFVTVQFDSEKSLVVFVNDAIIFKKQMSEDFEWTSN